MIDSKDLMLSQEQSDVESRPVTINRGSLVDSLLDGTGQLVLKATRKSHPPPYWLNGLVIGLFILLASSLVSLILNEFASMSVNVMLLALTLVGVGVAALLATKLHHEMSLKIFRADLIEAMQSQDDINDLQRWFKLKNKSSLHLVFSLVFGTLFGLYDAFVTSLANEHFVGFGPTLLMFMSFTLLGVFYFHVLVMLNMSIRIGRYQLKLFSVDPSSSRVIMQLRMLFSKLIYASTVFVAIYTFHTAFFRGFTPADFFFLIGLGWGMLLVIFVSYNWSLARIITGAKSQLLSRLEAKIEALPQQGDILNRDTLPQMNEFLRFREYLQSTPDSMVDLSAVLSLVNSLLLPLLAFLLANFDGIVSLINR